MRRLAGLIVAASVGAALFAGWATGGGAQTGASRASAATGTVTIGLAADPGKLDPSLTVASAANQILPFAYDSLVYVDGPGKVTSGLAESWKVRSPKRLELTLRRGVTCQDGSAVNAALVKRNLDFIADPANKSPLRGVYLPATAKVAANDKTRQVTVTTTIPAPFMLQSLAGISIVCSRGLTDRSLLDRGTEGSGPYRLVEAVASDHYTFAVRKGYTWGAGGATTAAPRLPARVIFKVVPNETTAANLLLTGGLDIASSAGDEQARLNREKLFKQSSAASPLFFLFNQATGHPLANEQTRRGVVQAMNLRQFGTVALSGRGIAATQFTRPTFTPCAGNSVTGSVPAYNPQAARSVLSGSSPSLKIVYPTDGGVSGLTPAMELVQQQLTAAGAKVTLAGSTSPALIGNLFGGGDWDVVVLNIGVSNPAQLVGFFSGPTPPSGTNFSRIDNADYGLAVTRANRRVGVQGCKFWLDGERALMRQADVAPSSAPVVTYYGNKATFFVGQSGLRPTSLRLLGR
jgi:peptide/nickel transport system substrate-binding protein